jgi:hypothetical protein
LMATTVMAMRGLGMARREGVSIPQKVFDLGLTYIENSSNEKSGHIGYSPRQGQKGLRGSGRTAGGLLALRACGFDKSALFTAAGKYVQNSYSSYEMNSGHASAQLSQSWAAWWSADAEQYSEFWAGQGAWILGRRNADGTFRNGPSDGKENEQKSQKGGMANAMHALMLVAGDGYLAVGEPRSSPKAAIPVAVDLVAKWGPGVPKSLTDLAELGASDRAVSTKEVAKKLADALKLLAKEDDPRKGQVMLNLLGLKPTYSASFDEKARAISVEVVFPAVRTTGIAKSTITIENRAPLMRSKPTAKSFTPSATQETLLINLSVLPENLDDQPLKAEIRWNLAGFDHVEKVEIPIERPATSK